MPEETSPQSEPQAEVQDDPQAEPKAKAQSADPVTDAPPKAKAPKPESAEEAQPAEGEAPAKAAKAAKGPKAKGDEGEVPKAKAPKKEAVEDKPFSDFIAQDYLPALEKAFAAKNVPDLKLSFDSQQVSGQWLNGQRQFTIYFPQGNINAQRAFSCTTGKTAVSTIEPFLGDERKITLDLLVFGVIQRINAQKWFGNN
jgi:Protein of unknown function (DUF2996)